MIVLLSQIDHMVKGHAAYRQLQEQAQQRSAEACSARLASEIVLHLIIEIFF